MLVASSALVAALCVTAAAVLAAGRHDVYVVAWVLAAVVTILVMVAPLDFLLRVDVALIAGPLAGLAVHLPWLLWRTWSRRR